MKTIVIVLVFLAAGYLWYRNMDGPSTDGPLPPITDPYYAEIRASNNFDGREIEVALFGKAVNESDCLDGVKRGWANIVKACPSCKAEPPTCVKELPTRYSRLFEDVPIANTYLSATSGNMRERDVRVVVYGVTDEEGLQMCEAMHKEMTKNYTGPIHCVAPK